jgi:uncharacterized protein DUF4112
MANSYTRDWNDGADVWSRRANLERLDKLSTLLDTAFLVPGTNIRFGIEAILRLLPGIGDITAWPYPFGYCMKPTGLVSPVSC